MKKICSLFILTLMMLSNVCNLAASFPLIFGQNIWNISEINVSKQYSIIKNMPETFVNICVEVTNDLKNLNSFSDREQKINSAGRTVFSDCVFALICSGTKNSVMFFVKKINNRNYFDNICFSCFYLTVFLFVFYLIRYIGLLQLFNSIASKQSLSDMLCPRNYCGQSFIFIQEI